MAILSEAYHSESDGDEDCTFRKSLNRDDEVEGGSSFSEDDRFNEDLSPEFAVEDIQNLAVSEPDKVKVGRAQHHYKTKALNSLPRENVRRLMTKDN